MSTHKPKPKFGWHGQVDHDGITIGDRVFHVMVPEDIGTIVDGPMKPEFGGSRCWLIAWDNHKGTFFHTCGTIRKQLP